MPDFVEVVNTAHRLLTLGRKLRRRPSRLTRLLSSSNLLLDVTDTQNGFPQGLKIIVKIVIEIEMSFLDGLEEFPL